jgi:hypothetical protein
VFHFVFSGSITSDYNKYGPIGVVIALMSYFIAIGVVISLGAVFGIVWNERKAANGTDVTAGVETLSTPSGLVTAKDSGAGPGGSVKAVAGQWDGSGLS